MPRTDAQRRQAEQDHLAWLATGAEDPIDPDQPIVDPHHHLWDRGGSTYLVEQLHADTGAGHNVVKTVFVECLAEYRTDGPEELRPVGETEFVAAQAELADERGGSPIAGIVAHADLTLGDSVEEVLIAHDEAGRGLFRGIRHAGAWDPSDQIRSGHNDPPPHLYALVEFRDGFARLGAMGLRFEAWQYHPQLGEVADLAQAHPEVPIVLNHIGAPLAIGPYAGRRDEVMAEWRQGIEAVAANPNVVCKVGGIGMSRYYGGGWRDRPHPPTSAELADYWADALRFCIDTFGPDRAMFESNFPVDRESCSYTVLWNTFQRVATDYSVAERQALFHDTAEQFYDLG